MIDPDIRHSAQNLVAQAGAGTITSTQRLHGGRNNQVFRLETSTDKELILKAYFHHAQDTRDRLGAEYSFCEYAWSAGVRCIPEPLAADDENLIGLYSVIPGRAPEPDDVDENAIVQVLDFLRDINEGRSASVASKLPDASEACLTTEAHIGTVQSRLDQLRAGLGDDPLDQRAGVLLNDVADVWQKVCTRLRGGGQDADSPQAPLSRARQCISPSDLGFHNALRNDQGQFSFLDFEYAGWDDPAKLICDFFHQEKVPVPHKFYRQFRDALIADHPNPVEEARRVDLLMPVYQVKWLIIRLNEFRPDGAHRRAFADPNEDPSDRKARQLEKAQEAFEALHADYGK